MKPHFGQSDAAMNKLAGCNRLPNTNKPADLSKLRNVPCSCVPCKHYGVSLDHGPCVSCRDHAKFEEKDFDPVKERDAAYDLGYKDAQQEHMKAQDYYGHHNGCDCAVCEDMHNRDLQRKELNESVAIYENQCVEAEKTIAQLTNDKNAALSKAEFWRVSHDAACEDAKNWRRDAQELQGTLNDILADLQGRNIHLLSKHCWCEPTGHPWIQK